MRGKYIKTISAILCLILVFRICFLSINYVNLSIVCFHQGYEKTNTCNSILELNFGKDIKQLINNINSIIHFFKNRIVENKKSILLFLLFLLNTNTSRIFIPLIKTCGSRFQAFYFIPSKKFISILRI
jgi:hypothetical protein